MPKETIDNIIMITHNCWFIYR